MKPLIDTALVFAWIIAYLTVAHGICRYRINHIGSDMVSRSGHSGGGLADRSLGVRLAIFAAGAVFAVVGYLASCELSKLF